MGELRQIRVPDIGDFKDVPIIEIKVEPGDSIAPEQPLVVLESDKASMEVPSPLGGNVSDLKVKVGDRVSEGTVILTLVTDAAAAQARGASSAATTEPSQAAAAPAPTSATPGIAEAAFDIPYAGPSVRKRARERGIDLRQVKGSGPRGRILPADVEAFTKPPAAAAPPN